MITEIITQLSDTIEAKAAFLLETSYSKVLHMDRYAGQYLPDVEGRILEFPCPALFFEFDFDFADENALSQNGSGILRLHICQERIAQSYRGSQDFAIAMRTYKFVEQLNVVLHGTKGDNFGKLQRRKWYMDKTENILVTDIVEYALTATDDTTNRYRDQVASPGDGTLNIGKQLVQKVITPPDVRVTKYSL